LFCPLPPKGSFEKAEGYSPTPQGGVLKKVRFTPQPPKGGLKPSMQGSPPWGI